MLAHPLEGESLDLSDFAAEWQWDGIRVQRVHGGGETRLYTRGAEESGGAFPDLLPAFDQDAVIHGALLIPAQPQGGARGGPGSVNPPTNGRHDDGECKSVRTIV